MKFWSLLIFIFSPYALACQCSNSTIEDFIEDSNSVYLISIEAAVVAEFPRDIKGVEISFDIIEDLSQTVSAPLQLYVLSNNCSLQLWPGNQYIVFMPKQGFYTDIPDSVSSCSGIIPINPHYPPDVATLKEVKAKIAQLKDKQAKQQP